MEVSSNYDLIRTKMERLDSMNLVCRVRTTLDESWVQQAWEQVKTLWENQQKLGIIQNREVTA